MTASYDEAVRTVMRELKTDEATASLIVADLYDDATAEPDSDVEFDSLDEAAPMVYTKPSPPGKVVPVDEERSPAGALLAQAARSTAEQEGRRYRELSRRSSMHER